MKFYPLFRFGFPMNLSEKLAPLTTDVLIDFNLKEKINKFDFFTCIGCEPMRIGLFQFKKLFIGLPFFFDYRSEKNINKDEITFFDDQAPNWKSVEGKEFLKNLVLSEKAKKYAIAEQVAAGQSWENLMKDLNCFVSSLYTLIAYFRIERLLQKKEQSLSATKRFVISSTLAVLIYLGIYLIVRIEAERTTNREIDKFLLNIKDRQEYIDGGIEYYTKWQKRNILQRKFMNEEGKWYFKANGNAIQYLSIRPEISEMIEKLSEIDGFSKKKE